MLILTQAFTIRLTIPIRSSRPHSLSVYDLPSALMHQRSVRMDGRLRGCICPFKLLRVRLVLLGENTAGNVGGNMIPNHVSG